MAQGKITERSFLQERNSGRFLNSAPFDRESDPSVRLSAYLYLTAAGHDAILVFSNWL